MQPPRMLPWMPWVAAAALASACGPVQSTSFLLDAEAMMRAARTAQAPRLAPYEWTAAELYYEKANEEVGYSDYEQAVDYARKAVDFATRARDAAQQAAATPPPPEFSAPPVVTAP